MGMIDRDNVLIVIKDLIDKVYEEETNHLNITRLEIVLEQLDKIM